MGENFEKSIEYMDNAELNILLTGIRNIKEYFESLMQKINKKLGEE